MITFANQWSFQTIYNIKPSWQNVNTYRLTKTGWPQRLWRKASVRSPRVSIIKCWQRVMQRANNLQRAVSSPPIIRDGRSMVRSSTPVAAVLRWPADCATSSRGGSSLCNRCTWVTNGRCISLPKWATANSHNQVFRAVPRSYSRLNCWEWTRKEIAQNR